MKQYIKTYFCCRLSELGVVAALWGAGLPCLSFLRKDRVLFPAYPTEESFARALEGSLGLLRREHVSLELLQPSCPQEEGEKAKLRKAELIQRKRK